MKYLDTFHFALLSLWPLWLAGAHAQDLLTTADRCGARCPARDMLLMMQMKLQATAGSENAGNVSTQLLCTEQELKKTRNMVTAKAWDVLESDPCMPENKLVDLRSGEEDLEDAYEYLGRTDTQNHCKKKQLPIMMYLGFGHSGSTSLCVQLNKHPEISYGNVKEHHYWNQHQDDLGWHSCDLQEAIDMYKNEFHMPCQKKFAFDCTIGNHGRSEKVRHRYREMVGPDAKFLFMFRSPQDRIHSIACDGNHNDKWVQARVDQGEDCYVDSIQNWLNDGIPRENFLFLQSEDYFHDPQGIINQVTDFMGAKRHEFSAQELFPSGRRRSKHSRNYPSVDKYWTNPLSVDCARRLEELLNMTIPWAHSQ